jgi:hypothetical protein
MAYVKHSTNNPLGRKPWDAMLQPGGLGAFFPNAEGIGSPSVMVDRDSANPSGFSGCHWSSGAPVPRAYYPPDAHIQLHTPRGIGLGALVHSTVLPRVGAPARTGLTLMPVTRTNGPFIPANTTPTAGNPIFQTVTPAKTTPVTSSTQPTQYSTMPATTTYTTPSGATVQHAASGPTSTAAQVSGTPVPVGTPTTGAYTDSSNNVWLFNGTTWYNASAQVAGTPVPVGTSTTTSYTDSSGNVWTFNGTVWTSPTVSSSSASSITSWLESSSIWSAVPNWAIFAGAVGIYLMVKKK